MTTIPAHENQRDSAARGESRTASNRRNWRVPSARGELQATSPRGDSPKPPVRLASLRRLTDRDLLGQLRRLRGTERAAQVAVVQYLVEVDRRRLYLPRGYGSLFEFCTEYLGYSRSAAARRIGAARCIGRFPRVAELFERGELDLTVIALVAGILTDENCREVVSWLRGRSLREVEAFAARRQPGRAVKDQVRKIFVMSVKQNTEAAGDTVSQSDSPVPIGAARDGTEPHSVVPAEAPRNAVEPDTAVSPAGRSEMPAGAARSGTGSPGVAAGARSGTELSGAEAMDAGAGTVAPLHHCPVSTPRHYDFREKEADLRLNRGLAS